MTDITGNVILGVGYIVIFVAHRMIKYWDNRLPWPKAFDKSFSACHGYCHRDLPLNELFDYQHVTACNSKGEYLVRRMCAICGDGNTNWIKLEKR